MKVRLIWILAAVILGLASALLPHLSLRWFLLYPYPLIPITVLILFLGWSPIYYLMFLLGPLLFFLSSPLLLRGKAKLTRKSLLVLVVFSVLEITFLLFLWRDGYRYQGERATLLVMFGSLMWLSLVWLVFGFAWRRQTYWATLAYHFVFVLWLLTYAFPWLGEML